MKPLISYLLAVLVVSIIMGLIYASVQQTYRSGANDPQIQVARDISQKLKNGNPVESYFTDTIDIEQNLATFSVLYDVNGKPLRSSGYLDGKMVQLPEGVFAFTREHGEHQVTWQPKPGVRMAMVIVRSNASPVGFVAAGRSLQEVEIRVHHLVNMVIMAWTICMGLVLLHAGLRFIANKNK